MEFKEFSNPLEEDYDITSSIKSDEEKNTVTEKKDDSTTRELVDLVGLLEDGEWEKYGISEEEYLNPTKETLEKIRDVIKNTEKNNEISL